VKDLEVPVLLCSQLNREVESEKREPELRDLRESGRIEQDSHSVTMLQATREDRRNVIAYIRKQRNGPLGEIPLRLNVEKLVFEQVNRES